MCLIGPVLGLALVGIPSVEALGRRLAWIGPPPNAIRDMGDKIGSRKLMRDAGCAQVLIGFESPDYSVMDGVECRSNWKARSAALARS